MQLTGTGGLIEFVQALVTALLGWAQSFVTFITSNPVILVFVITPLLFWAIGAIRRMLRL